VRPVAVGALERVPVAVDVEDRGLPLDAPDGGVDDDGPRLGRQVRHLDGAHPNVTAAHTRAHTTTAVPTIHTSRLRIPCAFSCHASYSPATHASRDARSVLARPAHGGESGP